MPSGFVDTAKLLLFKVFILFKYFSFSSVALHSRIVQLNLGYLGGLFVQFCPYLWSCVFDNLAGKTMMFARVSRAVDGNVRHFARDMNSKKYGQF